MKELTVNQELADKLTEVRRHLHQHPELSFKEFETAAYIASILEEWKIPYERIGETGIFVDIVGEKGAGLHIGVRADIDALPIEEKTGLPFASLRPEVMHACGHDGHTAILLGTVHQLFENKKNISGRVRCIFQPGEEADGAAKQMIEQGILDNPQVDGMLALHIWPHLPAGTIGIRHGAITASCDDFTIEVTGKGGHSARPHQAVDAIAISAQILQALPLLITKATNPVDPAVVHIGKIYGGTASNIVADRVMMEGTARAVSFETRQKLKSQICTLAEGLAASFGGSVRIDYADGHPPVVNNEWLTNAVEESAADILGADAVVHLKEPSMGADDFGAFAESVPCTYFRLGAAQEGKINFDLHHPQFEFHDSIIPVGVNLFADTIVNRLLKGAGKPC